jgi:hypothetical protein
MRVATLESRSRGLACFVSTVLLVPYSAQVARKLMVGVVSRD